MSWVPILTFSSPKPYRQFLCQVSNLAMFLLLLKKKSKPAESISTGGTLHILPSPTNQNQISWGRERGRKKKVAQRPRLKIVQCDLTVVESYRGVGWSGNRLQLQLQALSLIYIIHLFLIIQAFHNHAGQLFMYFYESLIDTFSNQEASASVSISTSIFHCWHWRKFRKGTALNFQNIMEITGLARGIHTYCTYLGV